MEMARQEAPYEEHRFKAQGCCQIRSLNVSAVSGSLCRVGEMHYSQPQHKHHRHAQVT